MFGKQKPAARTILLLDIENGSVGSALARIADGEAPKLFGEMRVEFKVSPTRDSLSLIPQMEQGTRHVLENAATLAGRLRNAQGPEDVRDAGRVARAAVILAAPWGVPNLGAGEPAFVDLVADRARREIAAYFGDIPHSTHTAAGVAFAGAREMMPHENTYIVCVVSGEVTEILLVADGVVAGYATVPLGVHGAIRTLQTHAGATVEEAKSALKLGTPSPYVEPLDAVASEYESQISRAINKLLGQSPGRPSSIYVISYAGAGEWAARSLSRSKELGSLLPQGTVRALTSRHAREFLAAHAEHPDLMLMLSAMFVATHL